MVAVLDQYEVEYKETYISGTYDQVVMGKMFYKKTERGIAKYFYGNRGVVYGSINSNQAPTPGISLFDFSNSLSYRLQPYKEKAGNCRAAKHSCYEERIYDTLTPNAIKCFRLNGASVFAIKSGSPYVSPGEARIYTGVETMENAFIMFDNYVPPENIPANGVYRGITGSINQGVDRYWTRSFPFEPRYSSVKREKQQNYNNIETNLLASFYPDTGISMVASFESSRKKVKRNGLIVGTVGLDKVSRYNLHQRAGVPSTGSAGSHQDEIGFFYHRWAIDTNLQTSIDDGFGHIFTTTGSCRPEDLNKILFGFGDATTVFYDKTIFSSNDPTGYSRRGTHNWPEFRKNQATEHRFGGLNGYESVSGSIWCTSPVIRGWKYGLYNGLPDFSCAYFRQGKYGQFRDMLEQRMYTTFLNDAEDNLSNVGMDQGPITVKFLDTNENLVDPLNTQSQNLSIFATSSLPYFDLQQRNRPSDAPLTNLSLVNFSVDAAGNITI
jgi:hypothetical protein